MQTRFKFISTRTGKSLILNIENKRYVFNLFEGFQRYAIEQNVSLKGIDTVFLPDSSSIPAFLGFYLTIRDMHKKSLAVVCNDEIAQTIEKAESICPKKDLTFNYQSNFKDEFIKVTTVNLKKEEVQNYIVEFVDIPGKLLIEKIPKELPKKFYSSLKEGKTVEFNKKKYKGEDYIEKPTKVGKILLVFGSTLQFKKYQKDEFRFVFCFNEIIYEKVKKAFNRVRLMSLNDKIEFISHYNIQKELNRLDSNFLMPILDTACLSYGHIAIMRFSGNTKEINIAKKEKRIKKEIAPVKNIMLNFRNLILKKMKTVPIRSGDDIIYDSNKKDFIVSSTKARGFATFNNKIIDNSLLFLGTGCAIPSKYRNVSSVLYNIDDKLVLFDCGEDSYSQLNRIYGNLKIITKLRYIFISHSHADHCLGIINLLQTIKHNVVVIAPRNLIDFLSIYNLSNVKFYDTTPAKSLESEFYEEYKLKGGEFSQTKLDKLINGRGGLETIYNEVITNYVIEVEHEDFTFYVCGVDHTGDSCSVSMVYKEKIKISYSGDTRPSPLFTIMAMGSDALIHESTFNSGNLDKAIKTRHSTVQEANTVFNLSSSHLLFLTHFSQRYPKGFVNVYKGIPCMDFYRYVLGTSTYNKNKINNYLKTLEN